MLNKKHNDNLSKYNYHKGIRLKMFQCGNSKFVDLFERNLNLI